ncbi:MAG: hypothetical protein J7539_01640 [Niabella sp.]|nr:hypothetical protein [Niabella sp.]
MKKHKNKDPFQTLGWCYTTVTDPRQVFAECFNYADIYSYRTTILQVLFAAASLKVYNKQDPASVLNKFKVIGSVLLAARRLTQQKETSALKIDWDQFTDKRLYARPRSLCPEWEYLPKTLTPAEYRNPYLVFHRFFNYQKPEQWRQDMDTIVEYALASHTDGCDLDLLRIYFHLTKLMEAAHLIDVREVTHVDGELKPALTEF